MFFSKEERRIISVSRSAVSTSHSCPDLVIVTDHCVPLGEGKK